MAHLPCAPTHPNIRLPSRAVAVWSKLLTQALGSGSTCGSTWLRQKVATARIAPAASAAGPSPRGVQCFTGPALGVFFGARVTRQPQTTNANRTAIKIPSSRLSTMLFSASGRSASVRGAGTPSPFGSTTQPSMLRFRTIARHVAGQGAGAVRRRGREDAVHHGVDRTGL
jgi:hypothetical protein